MHDLMSSYWTSNRRKIWSCHWTQGCGEISTIQGCSSKYSVRI